MLVFRLKIDVHIAFPERKSCAAPSKPTVNPHPSVWLASSKTVGVLITGGAGFIGSNLTEALLAQGNTVVCLDNFPTGKRANIELFLSHPEYTLIEGDLRDLREQ